MKNYNEIWFYLVTDAGINQRLRGPASESKTHARECCTFNEERAGLSLLINCYINDNELKVEPRGERTWRRSCSGNMRLDKLLTQIAY